MDQDTIDYIYSYYSNFMTADELKANRHYSSAFKPNGIDVNDRTNARVKLYYQKGWLSDDPKILALLESGFEAFKENVSKRIYEEHQEQVLLNLCERCGKLARTPKARQCPHCFHNWH